MRVNKAMAITRLAIKLAAPLPELESFNRYLFIGPHPDDIEIGAGATAAKLAGMGKEICFLICTDGRFGDGAVDERTSTEELIEIRRQEAISSAAVLGVKDVRFLNFSDGALYDRDELMRRIMEVIGDFGAEVVLAPDPCVSSECHADHLNVGEAARKAACFASYSTLSKAYGAKSSKVSALAYYMTAKANTIVKLSKKELEKQLCSVFTCHTSQFPEGSEEGKAIALYIKIRSFDHGLRRLCAHGEGFRVLGPTHMHCLPEAGI